MKKKIFIYAVIGIVMTSCLGDDEKNDITNYVTYETANLVIPADGKEQPFALSDVEYRYDFNYTHNTITVKTDELQLSVQKELAFETEPVSYFYGVYAEGQLWKFNVVQADSKVNGTVDSDYAVKDLSCTLTTAYYAPQELWDQQAQPLGTAVLMKYNVGDKYTVKTFPVLAYYSGKTTTSYKDKNDQEVGFSTTMPLYRIEIDVDDKKADVQFYNAKFAETMPMSITFTLEDLDVEFTNRGYYIKGENVVPMMDETPMERYVFNDFTLSCVDENLSTINVEYNVAGMYKGNFSGSYIVQ